MHTVPHSPPPAHFRVAVDGSDVSAFLAETQLAASTTDPDHPPISPRFSSRRPWQQPRHPDYVGDACVWWENWVAVAATGWGALVVIAPMLVMHFLVWAFSARRAE